MKTLLLILSLLAFSGCLTIEQSIRINNDSSVVVNYLYTYSQKNEEAVNLLIHKMQALMKKANNDTVFCLGFTSEPSVRSYVEAHGLELRQYRKEISNGIVTIRITILGRDAQKSLSSGAFGNFVYTSTPNTKRCEAFFPQITEIPHSLKEPLEKLCPDFQMKFFMTAPEKIAKTNGHIIQKTTAAWNLTLTGPAGKTLFNPPENIYIEW